MNIQTEVVEELPVSTKTSRYDEIIAQALELKPGQNLKVTNGKSGHSLGFTLRQLIKRREVEGLKVALRQKETYLVRI